MEIRALLSSMARAKAGPLLLAAQVALSLAVIVNVTHVIGQRWIDSSRPTGMDLANMFWVTTDAASHESGHSHPAVVKTDLAYLNALPGVVAAAPVSTLPQTLSSFIVPVGPGVEAAKAHAVIATLNMSTERIVDALGLRLVAGHTFDPEGVLPPADSLGAAVTQWAAQAVVTRALADRLYPDGHALGRPVYVSWAARPAVIVGIVGQLRVNPVPAQRDAPATQIVILAGVPPGPAAAYVIRTRPGRRNEVMARVERELPHLQPGRFVSRLEPYTVTAARARQSDRATILVLGAVAVVVLGVTVVGIVGLAAFNVSMRTRQLGVRRALGAHRVHILRYFLLENWITMTAGVAPGCVLAVAAGLPFSRVYEVPRLPLHQLAGGVLLLWAVGLAAVLVPALRAASVAPAVATRSV